MPEQKKKCQNRIKKLPKENKNVDLRNRWSIWNHRLPRKEIHKFIPRQNIGSSSAPTCQAEPAPSRRIISVFSDKLSSSSSRNEAQIRQRFVRNKWSFKFSCSQSPGRVSAGAATAPAREILFSQSCSSSRSAQSWALESVFIVISGFGGKNTTLITSKSGYFWFCFLIFVCVCFWFFGFFGFSFWGGVGGFLLLCFWVGFFCGFVFVFHSKDKLSYRTFFM